MDGRNRMLKEQLVSHLRFDAERSEVLLMAKGRCIMCGLAGIRRKDSSELVRMDMLATTLILNYYLQNQFCFLMNFGVY